MADFTLPLAGGDPVFLDTLVGEGPRLLVFPQSRSETRPVLGTTGRLRDRRRLGEHHASSSAVVERWSEIESGISAAITVTVDSSGSNPRSTCSGCQGLRSSSSARPRHSRRPLRRLLTARRRTWRCGSSSRKCRGFQRRPCRSQPAGRHRRARGQTRDCASTPRPGCTPGCGWVTRSGSAESGSSG